MYEITFTSDDLKTIAFVGGRYAWSEALLEVAHEGVVSIPEHKAWEIADAIGVEVGYADGGLMPMLDERSELFDKLISFWSDVV